MKQCKVEGCKNGSCKKGYCNKHYLKIRKYGDPLYIHPRNRPKTCIIEGCNGKHHSKGYCTKHYQKYTLYGDPLYVHPSQNRSETCIIEGCDEKHLALGYCNKHHSRFKRHGDPNIITRMYMNGEDCLIKGCDNKAKTKGYCGKHYKKYREYGNATAGISRPNYKRHGLRYCPEYSTWTGMNERCSNPKNTYFHRYGGRGITVCDRWKNSFKAFYEDMGPKPFPKAQIDRRNNNGNYEPGNCRWTTSEINNQNKNNNVLTIEKVREIRELYSKGNITHKKLSIKYDVSMTTIAYVTTGAIWKNA